MSLPRRFRVLLHGHNAFLRIEGDDKPALFGWYATRLVWAFTEADARRAALARVTSDLAAYGALEDRSTLTGTSSATVVEKIAETSRLRLGDIKGFTFYPEEQALSLVTSTTPRP
jgi:hypothetical protein